MHRRFKKKTSGFTLLELIAVVMIIGILAAVVMSRLSTQAFDAKKKCCLDYQRDLNRAIELFYFDHNAYPAQVGELNPDYYSETIPNCPVTTLPYDIDSVTHRIQGHNH